MEPKLPGPNRGPELPSFNYGQNSEHAPVVTPERTVERGVEQFEQRSEAPPAAVNVVPVLPTPVLPAVPAPVPTDTSTSTPLGDDLPTVANDDDLIEKEWVDKAKKIIIQTKDDPYLREKEVGKLQADYLRKRYGRELGAPQ